MKNKIEIRIHPNANTEFDIGGWPVRDEDSGIQINEKDLSYCLDLCKNKVEITVWTRDSQGDLDVMVKTFKINRKKIKKKAKKL